jgi:hypothetical protein
MGGGLIFLQFKKRGVSGGTIIPFAATACDAAPRTRADKVAIEPFADGAFIGQTVRVSR